MHTQWALTSAPNVPYSYLGLVVLLGAILLAPAGCTMVKLSEKASAAQSPAEQPSADRQPPSGEASSQPSEGSFPSRLKAGDIIETKTGAVLSLTSLLAELSNARVVYVGEMHTSLEDHRVQLEVLQGLYGQNPNLAVAMEMLPRDAQAALDRYSAGRITEERFLKESDWLHVWGYPFQLYRPIITWARERRLKLIGLNAPSAVVRKVARSGLASLTPKERKRIAAVFHFDHSDHRSYILEEYQKHMKGEIKGFETFYEAQLTWEETMAETLARSLEQMPENVQVLTLIGNGHIYGRWGVPRLTNERIGHTFKTVVTIPESELPQKIEPETGDFIWVTRKPEGAHRGRLGVVVKPKASGAGLDIQDVMPDSPAAKAGILKGDILVKIDGARIKSIDDVHKAMMRSKGPHQLTLKRSSQTITVTVTLPE